MLAAKNRGNHRLLAKIIALNQLPLSFCSSEGFLQFMSLNQATKPLKKEALKMRLKALKKRTKNIIKECISNV